MPPAPGRNDPCPCGSGKKFKKCCGGTPIGTPASDATVADIAQLMQQAEQSHRDGQHRQAAALLRQALARQPEDPRLLRALAIVSAEIGQYDAAAAYLRDAVHIAPNDAPLQALLGDFLLRTNRVDGAVSAFAKAVQLAPDVHEYHYNLGTLLKNTGRLQEAVDHFQRAIELDPADADCCNNLGNALTDLGRPNEAIAVYRKAVAIAPNLAQPHLNLATALQNQGHFDEAYTHYQLATETRGRHGTAYRGLSAMRKFSAADEALIARMATYGKTPGLPEEEAAEVAFALGKVYDDLAQYEKAFEHYQLGNSLVRRNMDFHQDEQVMRAERVMQIFSRDHLSELQSWGDPSQRPLFIIGMPRSGTSLVEQIISSHPAVHGAGELDFWRDEDEKLFPHYLKQLPRQARDIAKRYLDLLARLHPGAERVTDKLPGNFWHLGLIHSVFPNARIIHCKRNPVDTCLSIYFQKFAGDHPYAYDLDELACYYRLYRRLTKYWKNVLPEHVYTEVSYEELVANPEAESRRLIEFCGLEWSERCLDFHQHQRTVRTASSWQVRQPIYRTSRERWRSYEPFIAPLVKLLNEDNDSPSNNPTRPRTPTKPKTPGGALKRAA